MKNINFIYICIIFTALILFNQTELNAQVTVILQQPPPYQFRLENMWKVTLINPTKTTYRVYLKGIASESTQGQIVAATSASFSLPPGAKIVNSSDLVPLSVDVINSKYSNVIKNIGDVPTGDYEICVSVINAATGMELGTQCMDAQTQNLSAVELLQPENNTRFLSGAISEKNFDDVGNLKIITNSFITFSWMPPAPIPAGVKATYSIKIVEIFGNQSPYDALLSNKAFYVNQNIPSSVFLYPVQGRSFINNKKYAWKVYAYLNNVLVSESETWEFTYYDNSQQVKDNNKTAAENNTDYGSNYVSKQPLQVASIDNDQVMNLIYENDKEDKDVKPFLFSGTAKLNLDAGYKAMPSSELPNNVLTAELNPSIAIYGIPFTANVLLSTQQSSDKQSVNSASFNFDLNSYKQQLMSRLENKVSELATGWEKLLLGVDAFGIGTNYPSYTDYTLKGVPITGINVEINPGIFYAAFAGSKNQQGIDNIAYQRSLTAGRLGIGTKEGTHFFLTGLYVKDDPNSITVAPGNSTLTPEANYVFGAETKLALFNNHILIEGEGNVAVLTRDTRDADLEIDGIPSFIKNMISPKVSTSFDYAYTGKMTYDNTASATRISFGLNMVGPGYSSLGAPDLRNDQLAYEAKVDQGFLSRKITIGAFYRSSHDNLIDWKSSTTTATAFGINLGLNFPKLPFLQFSYSPYLQKNNDPVPAQKIENKTNMLSAVTGYTWIVDKYNFLTNIAYTSNESKTLSGLSDYSTNSISITESVSFNSPVSFAGTWGLIKTSSPSFNSNIDNLDLSVNAAFSEFLNNTVGINIASERSVNKKTGVYLNTTYSPLKYLNLSAKLEETAYTSLTDSSTNYNELLFNLVVNITW